MFWNVFQQWENEPTCDKGNGKVRFYIAMNEKANNDEIVQFWAGPPNFYDAEFESLSPLIKPIPAL